MLHFPNDKTLYHMGDTDIFSDMALINELHQPQIGLVPVGDRFTMGGAVAACARRRFFKFETVVPATTRPAGLARPDAGRVRGRHGRIRREACRCREVGEAVEVVALVGAGFPCEEAGFAFGFRRRPPPCR